MVLRQLPCPPLNFFAEALVPAGTIHAVLLEPLSHTSFARRPRHTKKFFPSGTEGCRTTARYNRRGLRDESQGKAASLAPPHDDAKARWLSASGNSMREQSLKGNPLSSEPLPRHTNPPQMNEFMSRALCQTDN